MKTCLSLTSLAALSLLMLSSAQTATAAGLTPSPTSADTTAGFLNTKAQVETATAVGTITSTGNAKVTLTSAVIDSGTPREFLVPVLAGDLVLDTAANPTATPPVLAKDGWAKKVRATLAADEQTTEFFEVGGTGATITLTRKPLATINSVNIFAANDPTLNLALENEAGTGITTATTSSDTTQGKLESVAQKETATAAGEINLAGNARVIVTADGLAGSPKVYTVAVALNEAATNWATKVRDTLQADSTLTALYDVGGTNGSITLTRKPQAVIEGDEVFAANDGSLNINIQNFTCDGIVNQPKSNDDTPGNLDTVAQVETAIASGTVTTSDNVAVVVTSNALAGSPKTIMVPVTAGDSTTTWAGKVRSALAADSAVSSLFDIGGTNSQITLTRKAVASGAGGVSYFPKDDPDLNLAILAVSKGIVARPISANTTEGELASQAQVETATAAGTIGENGALVVKLTASGLSGSPKSINVPVLAGDTASDWANKVRAAMNTNTDITNVFAVGGAGTSVVLTRVKVTTLDGVDIYALNDSTLNIALVTDTDDDTLADFDEINDYGTNPTDADTDGDGLNDNVEIAGGGNPLDQNSDTDGDGLKDKVETLTGLFLSASNTGTSPYLADTDGDGLNDKVETGTGIYVSVSNTGTNPNIADTDGDGLTDKQEIDGVNGFKSDPFLIDGDGDLVSDADEVNATPPTDPKDPSKYPTGLGITPLASLHALPVQLGDDQSVEIDQSFAPYGYRPDRDKVGDDGSGTVIDRNGVLIWTNKSGEALTIKDSTFAKTLHVSNTECLVYKNRFVDGWNAESHQAQIVIHRRGATGEIISSTPLTINGTVLDTASVTPTTYGYMLVSGKRSFDGAESRQINKITNNNNGVILTQDTPPQNVDQWDLLDLTLNIITWDGQRRTLAGDRYSIPKSNGANFSDGLALGYGSDGSLLLNMTTALEFSDRWDDPFPGTFLSKTSSIWVSATINKENVRSLPIAIDTLAYVDNDRLIGQRFNIGLGANEIVDYRQFSGSAVTEVSSLQLPAGENVLPLAEYSMRGLSPNIYTLDVAGRSLKLYKADATIASLGTAVTLPFAVSDASAFVRNPRDGSLLIESVGGPLIWVPTTTDGTTFAVTGLGAPKTIPQSTLGKPLFVTSKECVVWLNGKEEPLNGNLPVARISHFQLDGSNIISTTIAPPIQGKYVVSPNSISPDPELEGWYLTTFEKDAPASTLKRTYHLQLASGADRDGDGVTDYDELSGILNGGVSTDPFDPDSDADGLLDGQELLPFEAIVGAPLNWEAARLAAIAKGGKLAVLSTQQQQDRFKAAMLAAKVSGKFWVGGHDVIQEASGTAGGKYQWLKPNGELDGAEISNPKNWQQYQPNNTNNADGMEVSSDADFKWAMAQVSKIQAYVVEYSASNPNSKDTDGDGVFDNEERTLKGNPNIADTDGDGLTDSEEKAAGTDLVLVDTDGDSLTDFAEVKTHNTDPLKKDTDGDALEDDDEISLGTDPRDTDTDNDNLTDGDEVSRGTDPKLKDTDSDDLDDDKEVLVHLTDPKKADTDGDLISDFDEVAKGSNPNDIKDPKDIDTDKDNLTNFDELFVHNTDPKKADTDGDGINDDVEINNGGDPLDKESDTDGDGLKDKVETRTGVFVSATNTGTDPYLADTDGDLLNDKVETGTGIYVSPTNTGTNPNIADTDGDSLTDKEEIDFKSSPFVFDTDNDLASDADEYNATPKTNPRDPSSFPSAISRPEGLHAVVRSMGTQDVTIDQTFSPFGHRPDRDKVGDDGSAALIDTNGVLIWTDKDGQTFTIPNSSLAKTLFVSNTECIVYNNRFKPESYNTQGEVAEIIIHRRGTNGIISKTININGTLIDTAPVTATTYGFTILSGKRFLDGAESRQITSRQSTNNGVITVTEEVQDKDIWDRIKLTFHQITWDGQLKELAWMSPSIPRGGVGNNFPSSTEIKASGSDGSIILEMETGYEFVDRYDDPVPGVFLSKPTCYWATSASNQESIEALPGVFTEALYIDNDRALLERLAFGSLDDYEIVDYRQRAEGSSRVASSFALPDGERVLPLGATSLRGLVPYIYTLNEDGDKLRLYRADATITPVGAAITLPVAIEPSSFMIRNPRDASLLIKTEDRGLLWVPTTTSESSSAVTGFATPKFLPGTIQGKPLYVKADEAVAWLNSDAMPINGVLPAAQVSHFQLGATGLVVGVNLSSWIEGKYVVAPTQLSPDPDLEGWYITTFEKTAATSSKMRKYRLDLAADADRDDDGISDYLELTGFYNDGIPTDFYDPDTDGDGLSDGRELLPFEFVSDFKTWEEARLAAIAKGGRLAVLDDLQTPVLNPTMRQRILASIAAKNVADQRYWIGGHDKTTEGQILWLDKVGNISGVGVNGVRQIVFDDYADSWDQFQPSNVNNSDGLQISKTSLKWSMAPLETKQGYVIQYPKTDPKNASSKYDSDGDGLPDIVETNTGVFVSLTDRGTDPANKDTDGDTLPDNVETGTGIYVSANNTGTDPNKEDTDGDGFFDNEENNSGVFVSATNPGTDPNARDTDGDGRSDWDEAKSVGGFFSNPLRLDTDGDLVSDFDEVNAGTPPGSTPTDPNNPSSYPKSGITELKDLHTIVRSLGEPQSVAIDQSFAPFGHRPDRDKIGEDGSSVMIDRNGVLIWIDKDGKALTVPGSNQAKTLFVSNTECVVYTNRFGPDYNNDEEKAKVTIHRRNGSGAIISTPPTIISGTIIDTCPITPTTYGFNLLSGSYNGSTTFGTLGLQLNRLTWDGVLQPLAKKDVRIRTTSVIASEGGTAFKNLPDDLKLNATGSDGSMIFSLSADLNLNASSGSYNPQEILFWVSTVLNKDAIIHLSDKVPTASASQVAYVDNSRVIISRPKLGASNVNQLLDLRYSDAAGLTEASVTDLPEGDRIVRAGAYSIQGLVPYVYTINAEGNSLSLWEASGAPTRLLDAVTLPTKVQVGSAFVRNPRDGSILIDSDESGLIWIPTKVDTNGKPTELLAPRILPNTMLGSPLFVSRQEAVAWLNSQAPPLNGNLPPVKIAHYQMVTPPLPATNPRLTATELAPPIEGRYLPLPSFLTPDPDLEGWYLTSFEKDSPTSTKLRRYRLELASSADRDNDGLSDYAELRGDFGGSTDPWDPDTDNDGLSDGRELMPFEIVSTPLTWEAARLAAIAKGGKLAVLNTQDQQNRFRVAMLAAKASGKFWVGGHDAVFSDTQVDSEGLYRWLTGAGKAESGGAPVAAPTNWQPLQPNNQDDADGMEVSSSLDFKWAMAPVSRTQAYVIEYPVTDPNDNDSDGDDYGDGYELANYTNPQDPTSFPTYTLTLVGEGATTGGTFASTSDKFGHGKTATLTATPATGYQFDAWTGDVSGTNARLNPLNLVMDGNKTVGATFKPGAGDTDGDGLSDYEEILVYFTNPGSKHSDSDDLEDGAEVKTHKTNPNLPDTDGDGLTDKQEIDGVNGFKSNPLRIDSDGDLVSDKDEVNATPATDPNDPSKYPKGSGSTINPLTSLHALPVQLGGEKKVSIEESFAPFGHRPDRDKLGDDGSATIIDRNGVMIWTNKNGEPVTIPNGSFAKTLHVSNTECLVYQNRYFDWNNAQTHKAQIVIHRRGATGGLTSSKTAIINGTVLDTAAVTPTTDGYLLVSGVRVDDGEESKQITQKTNVNNGVTTITQETQKVDKWDILDLSFNIITWNGEYRNLVDTGRFSIPKNPGAVFSDFEFLGYGSDGSILLNMTTAAEFLDRYDDISPGNFLAETSSIWISAEINNESVRVLPTTINTTAYVDNYRVIGQRSIVDPLVTDSVSFVNEIVDYRQSSKYTSQEISSLELAKGERMLPLSEYSQHGINPYIYTLNETGTSLKLYTADATIASLGNSVTLPFAISDKSAFVRNPRDGSLLIESIGGSLIWVPTTTNGITPAVTGLGAPKVIPNSSKGKPLFVNSKECVVWLNSDEAPLNGNLANAEILHYRIEGSNLIATNLTPPMLGKHVVSPNTLSPDPDLEGWYLTTFEKDAPASTIMRAYHLQLAAGADRDGDGISDYDELSGLFNSGISTDPFSPDSDGDGISDGRELLAFEVVTTPLSWEAARLDAIKKGGKLAVLDATPNKQLRFKTAMLAAKSSGKFWVGGHDTLVEGEFRWLDSNGLASAGGTAISSSSISPGTNWQPFQPNNTGEADGMEVNSSLDFKWAMAPVSRTQAYVIEYPVTDPNINTFKSDSDGDDVDDYTETVLFSNPSGSSAPGFMEPDAPNSNANNASYEGLVYGQVSGLVAKVTFNVTGDETKSFTGTYQDIYGISSPLQGAFNNSGELIPATFNSSLELDDIEIVLQKQDNEKYHIHMRINTGPSGFMYAKARPALATYVPAKSRLTFEANSSDAQAPPYGVAVATGQLTGAAEANFQIYLPDGSTAAYSGKILDGDIIALYAKSSSAGAPSFLGNLKLDNDPAKPRNLEGITRLFSDVNDYDQERELTGAFYQSVPSKMPLSSFKVGASNSVFVWNKGDLDKAYQVVSWTVNGITPPITDYDIMSATFDRATGLMKADYILSDELRKMYQVQSTAYAVVNQANQTVNGFYYGANLVGGAFSATPNDTTPKLTPPVINIPDEAIIVPGKVTAISPVFKSITALEESYEIAVTGIDNWSVSIPPAATWLSAEVISDDGSDFGELTGRHNGKVLMTVAENLGADIRKAIITIGDKKHEITQSAGSVISISSYSIPMAASGGVYSLRVQAIGKWKATVTTPSWIKAELVNDDGSPSLLTNAGGAGATSTFAGSGNATITVEISPNATPIFRSGSIIIGNLEHIVTQRPVFVAGSVAWISPDLKELTFAATEYTIRVAGTDNWEVSIPDSSWINVQVINDDGFADPSNLTGSGNATLKVSVLQNFSAAEREGIIDIGGIEHTVTQSPAFVSGNVTKITPRSRKARGGDQTYSIRATGVNNWLATTSAPWIKVLVINDNGDFSFDASNSIGSRNARVQVTLEANTTGRRRTGTINIGGRVHKVTQAFRK